MRTGVLLAVIGATGLAGAQGLAQDLPSFPRSLERDALLAWLQRETDILADRVVAVTPQAITSVVSTFPAAGGQGPRVVIRAEALNGETYARTGALSWHVSMSADCSNHRVRLGETTGYPARNLLGERRVLRPAESEWRRPDAGTALDNAWRAACEPRFQGPFAAAGVKVAQSDPASSPPVAAAPAETPAPKAAPKPAPPAKTALPAKPAPPATTARPAATPKVAVGGPLSVQIGSFPDEASAKAALARLHDGRPHSIEAVVVGGRAWRRAVVGGFASSEAAGRYCVERKTQGGACLVRAAPR